MDLFAPLHGIPLEQYAELLAEVADHPADPEQCAFAVAQKGVARSDWEAARAGWTARLTDTALGGAVALRFAPLYQAALLERKGPPPQVGFEDFAAMTGEALARGVEAMLRRHGLEVVRWSQIGFQWHAALAHSPANVATYLVIADQECARLLAGGAPRPVPSFMAPAGATAPTGTPLPTVVQQPPAAQAASSAMPAAEIMAPAATPQQVTPQQVTPQQVTPQQVAAQQFTPQQLTPQQVSPQQVASQQFTPQQLTPQQVSPQQVASPQVAAAHAPTPPLAGAYQDTPPGAQPQRPQRPQTPQTPQTFERQAEQALHAVGGAMSSGLKELGSALDSFGKSISRPKVGSRVLVAWSDGNRYPGTVAQVGQGQYLVTMGDGQQHWVPEAYVKPA